MRLLSVAAVAIALSSPAHAAQNTDFAAQTPGVHGLDLVKKQDRFSDMATIDRLISDREYAKAIPVLEHVLSGSDATQRDRSIGYNLKGLSLYMVGRVAEAIDDFSASLRIQDDAKIDNPHRWKTIFNRGIAYEAAKDLRSAADDYVRAYAMAPNERLVKRKIYNFFNKE
jgi:tetratricopeptide (TPR) repeat protein